METFEMRYFVAVAKEENIHRASETIHISPGSLSKAISRLEDELGVRLFFRQGRNIKLTPEGQIFKRRAQQIIGLEEDARLELGGKNGSIQITLGAEEVLLTKFGIDLCKKIQKSYSQSQFQLLSLSDKKVIELIENGDLHFGLISSEVPNGFHAIKLSEVEFKTCAARDHEIFKDYSPSSKIPVEEVLKYAFVLPEHAMLGKIHASASSDGWRDDKFKRKQKYFAPSLKVIEQFVTMGEALAYLPDYYIKQLDFIPLKIVGCPYTCKQSIKIVCKEPERLGWISRVWSSLAP